ncbi:peptidoglycan/xylan/chitin deacetylase (PgdA/CDA1 family) [Bacillus pakistanensis]|uniref:Peptidoglycan/xylan/chitin deacetylase (PgdA/CDA1 family) n=1 Tax=Rossellomorea pakistanensis TaxID=992288 RepID=A0ABS2NE71_9BACI|nr:polysaccharide deacetylase family protein [Bacillus pakistanensis]MBM7586152.1 peptidoglycan/xylan/chitin deacetylase (PgdA/CDA1 family) [Bacillus pakistanensis]
MERQKKTRNWIKPYEIVGVLGLLLLLTLFSTMMVIDQGEAKAPKDTHSEKQSAINTEAIEENGKRDENESSISDENEKQRVEVTKKENQSDQTLTENEDKSETVSPNKEENTQIENNGDLNDQGILNEKTLYITFDDGPNENTKSILNLLNKYNAKATFFMLEPNMRKFPEAVTAMVENGHAVGLHGVSHNQEVIYESSQSVVGEMTKAQRTLENIAGIHSDLIRVPYGSVPHMKPSYFDAVDQKGFKLWDWNIDSEDWKFHHGEFVQKVLNQLEEFPYQHEPKVVLLHEKSTSLQYLDSLLQKLTDMGYQMQALTEQMDTVTF